MDNFENNENFDIDKINELQQAIENAQQFSENSETPVEQANTQTQEVIPDLAHWEEFSKDNSVVKKYITYISKDFVDMMDKMSTDERSAYINDAIQKKIDIENVELQTEKKRAMLTHMIIAVAVIIISMPVVLIGVNKAIMHTFDNYKYSQDNFEKLYKHRFEKEKAQIKTLQHNMLNKNKKSK